MQNAERRGKATQSQVQARYKPCDWEGIERCKPGTCVVHAWYKPGTSLPIKTLMRFREHLSACWPGIALVSESSASPCHSNGLKLSSLPVQGQTSWMTRFASRGQAGLEVELAR